MTEVRLSRWQDFENEVSSALERVKKRRSEAGAYVSDLLFRGHENSDWKLDTTLERYGAQNYTMRNYHSIMVNVKPLVKSFTERR